MHAYPSSGRHRNRTRPLSGLLVFETSVATKCHRTFQARREPNREIAGLRIDDLIGIDGSRGLVYVIASCAAT